MNAALELEAKSIRENRRCLRECFTITLRDPMVDGSGTESEEEIRQAVLEELKPNGLVNDDPEIYGAMDTELSGSSAVIPVALKADGSLKATSKTASTEEFGTNVGLREGDRDEGGQKNPGRRCGGCAV